MQEHALYQDAVRQLPFPGLQFLGQLLAPIFQPPVELAELFKLDRLAAGPPDMVGMIEEQEQVAADLAELG